MSVSLTEHQLGGLRWIVLNGPDTLAIPAEEPGPDWFLRVLTKPSPDGVRADPAPGRRAATLCTFVADLTSGEAVVAARDERPVTIPLRDLAEGRPSPPRPASRPS